ncbi:hypothetical protein FHX76_000429 [Lysinibacter cavernae]|uniref:Uncharacterized protein n=1 Tax=Lysinibacter cavernae TaxID=1640652 RepID=A0A7X5QYZ1_9MICO|nr:hypothetical protein [Lysinibacter cavernae]
MPPSARGWLIGAAAFVTVTAGILSKVMALPTINDWLSRHTLFGTVPKAVAAADTSWGEGSRG